MPLNFVWMMQSLWVNGNTSKTTKARKVVTRLQVPGSDLPIGMLLCAWQSSELLTEMTSILIQEALGYHTIKDPKIGANGASPIYALAGCVDFDNSSVSDKRCGQQEAR